MVVAFIGHRKIDDVFSVRNKLRKLVETLIVDYGANTFVFGSKSIFDDICYSVVTSLMYKYDNIRRVYVGAEFGDIDKSYIDYLSFLYEETLFPNSANKKCAALYLKRNEKMIDLCDTAVVYLDDSSLSYAKAHAKSCTKYAIRYALRKNKTILNVYCDGE